MQNAKCKVQSVKKRCHPERSAAESKDPGTDLTASVNEMRRSRGFASLAQDDIFVLQVSSKFRFIELFAMQKKYVIPRSAATWESPAEQ